MFAKANRVKHFIRVRIDKRPEESVGCDKNSKITWFNYELSSSIAMADMEKYRSDVVFEHDEIRNASRGRRRKAHDSRWRTVSSSEPGPKQIVIYELYQRYCSYSETVRQYIMFNVCLSISYDELVRYDIMAPKLTNVYVVEMQNGQVSRAQSC